ncbi:hypothetical protein B0H14DRAFT_2900385 [Mycena olivaceomarginata]|nr:hypothetical protein B0H14DRAFT_2900385 [Mycena olivaceomarginata]
MRKLKPAYFLACLVYWLCAALPCLTIIPFRLCDAAGTRTPRTPPTMTWYVPEMDRKARAGTAEDAMAWSTGLRGSGR